MLRTRTRPSDRSGTGASTISKCSASGTPDGLDFSLTCRFTRRCTAQYLPRPSSPNCTLTLTSWLRHDGTGPNGATRCVCRQGWVVWCAPVLLLCQGGARFQGVEDDADELSLEAADRFAAAFAFCLFAFQVRARCRVVARL